MSAEGAGQLHSESTQSRLKCHGDWEMFLMTENITLIFRKDDSGD